MPPLSWEKFEHLPGSVQINFEMLCRALIRRHYGQYGAFVARANQPGVEFHLKLHTQCSLGDPGRWYGWQCRWYDLPRGRALGTTRRNKIARAITITKKVLPDLTDWVLWTRHSLTKGDQDWYYGLKTQMRLDLWTAEEVEEHLSGSAVILRGTYFDELVLTPDALTKLHEQAVAPILRRWQPEVHQAVDAERTLRRMLGESCTWDELQTLAGRLETYAITIESDLNDLVSPVADATAEVAVLSRSVATSLVKTHSALQQGDFDLLQEQLTTRPAQPDPKLAILPRQLRNGRFRAALTVTNALAYLRSAHYLLDDVDSYLSTRIIAVAAEMGCGKTQLAAQLTQTNTDRPDGVLLHGGGLQAGDSLDDLARQVVIQGTPVPSMEALVAAVDAAGQRAHRRLPIVIDALNEAEDPRDWKAPLASMLETLKQYPYVLIVVTLRTAFVDEALPSGLPKLEIPDFEHDTVQAVRRYFEYYRIDPKDARLPWGLLRHPLTLRLFCEVTNPTREQVVGIESMPGSLTSLFERYLEQAAQRITQLAPRTCRYYEQDVRAALDEIGVALWEMNARSLDLPTLRRRLGDDKRPWNESIVQALEQDGVLARVQRDEHPDTHVAAAYDALAGYLVASAILSKYGRLGFQEWLGDPATATALAGSVSERHPLATDTLRALVGLVPRRLNRQQLWQLLEEPLRTPALRGAADLEGAYLDAQTVDQLALLIAEETTPSRGLFDRLWQTRGLATHPLNAAFLDDVLRARTVAERDLRWTEWVRRNQEFILADLQQLDKEWQDLTERSPEDRLRARWVAWILTSTVRKLRDHATRVLYWFGRGDPAALFELTLDSITVNDLYLPERLLAASYGVVMARQIPDPEFTHALAGFLGGLRDAFVGPAAHSPTNHWLMRLYVQGIVTFTCSYYPEAAPEGIEVDGRVPFAAGPPVATIDNDDPRAKELDHTLHMDFRNYTLGSLFGDRPNYDMSHQGYQAAVAHARGVVWVLGWRMAGLGVLDKELARYAHQEESIRTERYGKKYGWIGFYTYAGMLSDDGQLFQERGRLSEVQIDPSFPESTPTAPFNLPAWVCETPADDHGWICQGEVLVPDELFCRTNIGSHPGPWIAVSGYMNADEEKSSRRVFGLLTALLVESVDSDRLVSALQAKPHPGRWWLPEVPGDYYTFAGEIPWSPDFARNQEGDPVELYRGSIQLDSGAPIDLEILAHRYTWEDYHSTLNQAGGALVPSRPFSVAFDLRGSPQSFSQALPNGTVVALSLSAPAEFRGHLLYLREDLVHQYAGGRRLIWFIWGERQLYPYPDQAPNWLVQARQSYADVWRYIVRGEHLSHAFAEVPS